MNMKKTFVVVSLLLGMAALAAAQGGQVLLNAAGATFPYPIYSKWFDVYHKAHPNVQINYQSIGSGGGIRQLQAGTVDFGASDGPMTDEQLAAIKVQDSSFPDGLGRGRADLQHPGSFRRIEFHAKGAGGNFPGKDHEVERSGNRQGESRGEAPQRGHRGGSPLRRQRHDVHLDRLPFEGQSGVEERKSARNTSVNWPVGLGGKGNEGVAGLVKQTPDSIGYIELIYAVQNKIAYGKVQNAAGKFVKADLASVTAAAAGAAKDMPDDFRVSITNAPGATAYPISSFTWLLIPAQIPGRGEARRDQGFPEVDADGRAKL